MTRYLDLAEYLWLAEQVTGVPAETLSLPGRIELADALLPEQHAEWAQPTLHEPSTASLRPASGSSNPNS